MSSPVNAIATTQNSPDQLAQLGAYSQLYLYAKRLYGLNIFLSVPSVLVWSLVVALFPDLTLYGALWGAAVTLLSAFWLSPAQQELQVRAAKVQQLCDCAIFELTWDAFNIGSQPEPEEIIAANAEYIKTNPTYEDLKNWYYPSVQEIPLYLARLVCQRTCCWWDGGLRKSYAAWNIRAVLLLSAIVLVLGFTRGLTLERFFLAVIVPLLPALTLGLTQYREHLQAAANLDRLRENIEAVWDRTMKGQETEPNLNEWAVRFQDKLFDNRSRNPLIFNWFYKLSRLKNEQTMAQGAQEYVDEAISTLGPFRPSP